MFAVEVAEQEEINANKSAAGHAQSTANQGVAAAAKAQSAANQAQNSASQAGTMAAAAGVVAVTNAADVNLVNERVSDLDLQEGCRSRYLLSYGPVHLGCSRKG